MRRRSVEAKVSIVIVAFQSSDRITHRLTINISSSRIRTVCLPLILFLLSLLTFLFLPNFWSPGGHIGSVCSVSERYSYHWLRVFISHVAHYLFCSLCISSSVDRYDKWSPLYARKLFTTCSLGEFSI